MGYPLTPPQPPHRRNPGAPGPDHGAHQRHRDPHLSERQPGRRPQRDPVRPRARRQRVPRGPQPLGDRGRRPQRMDRARPRQPCGCARDGTAAQGVRRLVQDDAEFTAAYDGFSLMAGQYSGDLADAGEQVSLLDGTQVVDTVTYSRTRPRRRPTARAPLSSSSTRPATTLLPRAGEQAGHRPSTAHRAPSTRCPLPGPGHLNGPPLRIDLEVPLHLDQPRHRLARHDLQRLGVAEWSRVAGLPVGADHDDPQRGPAMDVLLPQPLHGPRWCAP